MVYTVYYFRSANRWRKNAATFEILGEYWAHDADRIYFQDDSVSQAERSTFELIDVNLGTTDRHVYEFGKILDNADPGSFQRIGESLFLSRQSGVFCIGYPGGWVDGKTWRPLRLDPTVMKAAMVLGSACAIVGGGLATTGRIETGERDASAT